MENSIKKISRGIGILTLVGASAYLSPPQAKAADPNIYLCNRFRNTATDQELNDNFFAFISPSSTDNYDLGDDILNPPPVPGDYSDLSTLVDGFRLMEDKRSPIPLFSTKTWPLDLILGNQTFTQMSGENTIVSDLSQIPSIYNVSLIDYGLDAARTLPINIVDLRTTPDYQFPLSGIGISRYLDLSVEHIPEPSTGLLGAAGAAAYLASRKRQKIS